MNYNRMLKVVFILLLNLGQSYTQEPLLMNVYHRTYQSLHGEWDYIVDPYENGFYNYRYEAYDIFENPVREAYFLNTKPKDKSDRVEYDFDTADKIKVPGDWNSQKENLFYYEGTIWYRKLFDYTIKNRNTRTFLYFGAVNYQADVYLNGTKLGTHFGGFTPFNYEITNFIKEKDNFLIVKVDNKRRKEAIPTLNTDWWNYGGITRDVMLIETPGNFIQDYFIQLDPENELQLKGYVRLNRKHITDQEVTLIIPEISLAQKLITDTEGVALLKVRLDSITCWSTKNPKLYEVILRTAEDEIHDQIGFRTVRTSGSYILLNGKRIFLKGISIHEENPIRGGRAHSIEDARQLLMWAKELGCNYVRLAHYPHNEHIIRLADQMGILVWEEIPVYWTIEWNNQDTYRNAENQLKDVISRDKNRACVIIWSVANETPASEARNNFLTKLANFSRALDPTRLISAALEQHNYNRNPLIRTIDDPFTDIVDVISFNDYIGWYDGLPDKCRDIEWKIIQNKPVIISEFGAGAKYGFHGDSLTRWSEEYQEYLYIETLKMISKIEQLRGISPWILVDFRSPRRHLPKIQDGWNRKGLISESGNKKKAFYVLKTFYDKKPEFYDH